MTRISGPGCLPGCDHPIPNGPEANVASVCKSRRRPFRACQLSYPNRPEASAAGVMPGAFGIGCAANLSRLLLLARFRHYIRGRPCRACQFPDRSGHAASGVEEGAFRSGAAFWGPDKRTPKTRPQTGKPPLGFREDSEMTEDKLRAPQSTRPRLTLGQVVMTPGVSGELTNQEIHAALYRHQCGDWGMVCPSDWNENDEAISTGCRVLSAYESSNGLKFWIITEWDRSVTTVLLPEEY